MRIETGLGVDTALYSYNTHFIVHCYSFSSLFSFINCKRSHIFKNIENAIFKKIIEVNISKNNFP